MQGNLLIKLLQLCFAEAAAGDGKSVKVAAVASDGQFWISRVLSTIETLEQDTKHIFLLIEVGEPERELRRSARKLLQRLREVCLLLMESSPMHTVNTHLRFSKGEPRKS